MRHYIFLALFEKFLYDENMNCPKCHSDQLKKNGIVFGAQRYRCKACGFQFIPNASHGRTLEDKGMAVSLAHMGVSQNQIAHILGTTPTSVARWLRQLPTSIPFRFNMQPHLQPIEESNLRSYIKQLYIENKEDFFIAKNSFDSHYEVDLIIKNRKPSPTKLGQGLLVCAFGDSLLQGVVHDAQQNKYKILKENFANLTAEKLNVTWYNYARHGSTVIDGAKAFLSHLSQVQKSDYILFSFGGNECNHNWDRISANPTANHQPRLSLEAFRQKYIYLIRLAQKRGKTPILFSLPPVHAETFVNSVCIGRNRANILRFLGSDIHVVQRWHNIYNLEVFKIAKDMDIPIIDITTCFLEQLDYSSFICDDGFHPNEKGHQLIAGALAAYYRRYF